MNTIYFNSDHDEQRRREELYQGQIYVYGPTPGGLALCALARRLCEEAFAPHDPRDAQDHLPVESYVKILQELKPRFIHHPDCKQFIPQLLRELGCDMDRTFFDVPRLRTATSGDYLNTGLAYAFKPHRDTWYSPPMCQINWWLPVYPVTSDNVMAFHPAYWDRPIRNSSCLFNYQVWNETGRKQAATQVGKDTRVQSEALEPLQAAARYPVGMSTGWGDRLFRRALAFHRAQYVGCRRGSALTFAPWTNGISTDCTAHQIMTASRPARP